MNLFRKSQTDQILPAEARKRHEAGTLFVDVREPDEYAQVRIPGSILIPMSELNERYNEIPEDREVIIYCRSGNRSRQVVDAFREQLGYTNLLNLEGGILAWYDSGYPVDTQPVGDTYQTISYPEIDVVEAHARLQANELLLVDVREPDEYANGHLPGAINIPLNSLSEHLHELQQASTVLLVCNTGNRSGMAAEWLTGQGLTGVINIDGGTVAWLQHGFAIEK